MYSAALASTYAVALTALCTPSHAPASGLDVQLKDLRNSFYFVFASPSATSGTAPTNPSATPAAAKECITLTSKEVRKFGRLLHCKPEDDYVMCRLKSGEKLFAYESKEACENSLRKGTDPTPD